MSADDECPEDLRPSRVTLIQRRFIDKLRLTELERHILASCYSDGYSEADVAGFLGVPAGAVRQTLRRACNKVVAAGLPRPRPYGRGSREELRAAVPALVEMTT
jgi:hypothetical protein